MCMRKCTVFSSFAHHRHHSSRHYRGTRFSFSVQ
jgi:hypothetical protein